MEDGWWMVRVPEFGLRTQAARWSEVERMGRGVIAAMLDVKVADVGVEVEVVGDDKATALLDRARSDAAEAERLSAQALESRRRAARHLQDHGWKLAPIGRLLGVSYQRADQIIRRTR